MTTSVCATLTPPIRPPTLKNTSRPPYSIILRQIEQMPKPHTQGYPFQPRVDPEESIKTNPHLFQHTLPKPPTPRSYTITNSCNLPSPRRPTAPSHKHPLSTSYQERQAFHFIWSVLYIYTYLLFKILFMSSLIDVNFFSKKNLYALLKCFVNSEFYLKLWFKWEYTIIQKINKFCRSNHHLRAYKLDFCQKINLYALSKCSISQTIRRR
jgi:hypothetical protein